MAVVIIRPRRAVRDVLAAETQRQYLDIGDVIKVDAVLAKPDEDWPRKEFRFLMRCLEDIDEAQ